jgi:hypothetical protein
MRWFRLVKTGITSHLSGLKCISQSDSQCWRLPRSIWNCLPSAFVNMVLYRRQSFANNLAFDLTLHTCDKWNGPNLDFQLDFEAQNWIFLSTRITMRVWFKESILPSKSINDHTFYDFCWSILIHFTKKINK